MRRSVAVALLTIALASGTVLTACTNAEQAGQANPPAQDASRQASEAPDSGALLAGEDPFVNRGLFTPDNFGLNQVGAAEKKLKLKLHFPASIPGGDFQGVFLPDAGGAPSIDAMMAVYSNDVVVEVSKYQNAPEAADVARAMADPVNLEGFVEQIEVKGRTAYARPRIDIAPDPDPETGVSRPGTGVRTTAAMVVWSQGPFVVSVASPDKTVEELLAIIQDVDVEDAD